MKSTLAEPKSQTIFLNPKCGLLQTGAVWGYPCFKKRNKDMKKVRKALCDKFATLNDKFNNFKTRLTLVLLTGILSGLRAAAAGNGMAGINEATSMVTSYFDPGV